MFKYMEELSLTEAENLRKTISNLFKQTCILQVKYDPVTLTPRDNIYYEMCVRHKKFIEDYLMVLGCELTHDPQEHIFRLTGEGVETERFSLTTTINDKDDLSGQDSRGRAGSYGNYVGGNPRVREKYKSSK